MSKPEDSVRRLLDIHEIQQLLLKCAIAWDAREYDLVDQLFTTDAQFNLAGLGGYSVAEYKKRARSILPELDATQHFCGPPVIRIEGDKAFARSYYMAQHARNSLAPQPFLMIAGHYDDELYRHNGEWRITKRTGTATWVDGNPAVLGYAIPAGGVPWSETRNCPSWLLKR